MSEPLQRRLVMLFCLQCAGDLSKLSDEELAHALRIETNELVSTLETFREKGFLDNKRRIRNWNKRQFKSDLSTDRVRAFRQRSGNVSETETERPQIQIQITDTDTENTKETTHAGLQPAPAVVDCPKNEIVSLYHEILPRAPRVEKWTDTRARMLRARWREHPSIDLWRQYFSIVKASKFLTGKTNGHGDRPPFVADLEWLIKPSNFAKVLEGRYDNR